MTRFLALLVLVLMLFAGATERAVAQPQTLNIGLFFDGKPASLTIANNWGGYTVFGDKKELMQLDGSEVLIASVSQGQVVLKTPSRTIGAFKQVYVKRNQWGASMRVKTRTPSRRERVYRDNLTISPWGSRLRCVNNVYIEHYLPGVVQAESGVEAMVEYYKVQAVIARTYALNNYRRHAGEGYHLCDDVHCQVYKGNSELPAIKQAVKETKSMVLVDSDINLITASFFSNCGGQTMNSEDVWTKPVPYLRSKTDSFCVEMPHSHWDTEIPKDKWLHYLAKNSNFAPNDSTLLAATLNYCPSGRETFFPLDSNLLLTNIRRDFGLRSTYIRIEEKTDESLVVHCKGFGHGVGLCQEGAMCMAEYGYKFNEILHHYYTDVHLIDLSVIDFFRE